MKNLFALLTIALLSVVGCSSTCHDGQKENILGGGIYGPDRYSYSPCKMGCMKGTKTCGCSKQCPCWDQHTNAAHLSSK